MSEEKNYCGIYCHRWSSKRGQIHINGTNCSGQKIRSLPEKRRPRVTASSVSILKARIRRSTSDTPVCIMGRKRAITASMNKAAKQLHWRR